MWGHPTEERLFEILEGVGRPETERHVERCAACRERLDEARAGMDLASAADVPEPSPLYWEALRRQIDRKLAAELSARRRIFFPALLTAAATVVLSVGLLSQLPNHPVASPEPRLPAWSALPGAEDDLGLTVIQALATENQDLGGLACRGVADCIADLSDEESAQVAKALRRELAGRTL